MRLRRVSTEEDTVIEYSSFEEFNEGTLVPNGRFSVIFNGIPVDFLFENRNFSTTVVGFHGAVQTTVDLPFHTGEGVMRTVNANRIAVSDPSLIFGNDLKLGWFAGSNRQVGLQEFIGRVLRCIFQKTSAKNLIFFGASGGGFSAIEMSLRFHGSLAVPMNPQTSITEYHQPAIDLYVDTAWDGVDPFSENQQKLNHNLVDLYPEFPDNIIAYIQNTRDKVHIKNQQLPFYEKVGKSPNIWHLMDSWGSPKITGHTPPPKELVTSVLQVLAESDGQWDIALKTLGFSRVNEVVLS